METKISIGFWMVILFSFLITSSYVNCQVSNSGSNKKDNLKQSSSKISLIILNEDDWEQILQGEWMVEFHAPWCPACRSLQPDWKSFSSWSSDLGIKIGAVDVNTNPSLSGRFMVTTLPTIYHVKDGVFRQYKGTRDTSSFVSFIEEKQWQSIEPISSWIAPNSIAMSTLSNFFKISMTLRAIHNSLVEDYGIPYWGSYILFGFATILFGSILGLMIVFIIDIIFPAKTSEDILERPTTQGDLIDDTEDLKNENKHDDDETDEEFSGEGDEEIEMEEKASEASEPEESKQTNIRQRKARRD